MGLALLCSAAFEPLLHCFFNQNREDLAVSTAYEA